MFITQKPHIIKKKRKTFSIANLIFYLKLIFEILFENIDAPFLLRG